jgi:hypothetical protein
VETITVEAILITVGREDDGRWWADIDSAITAVRALALRVAADCIDHGEEVPAALAKVFSMA